ncbi:DUF4124 domain-containing protein [Uliginosibacterium sp. H1]|uniref:DUF4124 domain-containing protein n=1 Tax=Uliginosibacterium sp. H1 TaxID=3114757 RepID=UPI002E198705|nr:DUF4124 domain-containing protein [Uliginosibacterium sp. H1]
MLTLLPAIHGALLAAALLTAGSVQAQTYKWVDAQGRTHYGDSPPPGVRARVVEGGVNVVTRPPQPAGGSAPTASPAPAAAPQRAAQAPAAAAATDDDRAAQRQRMIERCERNRGVDCEDEVDAMLDGVPDDSYAEWPVYARPPLWPGGRPPPKPRPPRPPRPKAEEPPRPAPVTRRIGDS